MCCFDVFFCILLYYTITILYYTIIHYDTLYYTILYYTTMYYTILLLYYTILYYTVLYYTITILYYTITIGCPEGVRERAPEVGGDVRHELVRGVLGGVG